MNKQRRCCCCCCMYVVYIFFDGQTGKTEFQKLRVLQLHSCFDGLCILNENIVINGKEKEKKLCINLSFQIYFSTTFSSIPTLIGRSNVKLRWSESDHIDESNDKQAMCRNLDNIKKYIKLLWVIFFVLLTLESAKASSQRNFF